MRTMCRYCFAITIPAQMLGAYKLLEYWGPAPYLGPLVFYGITPWALFALNLCGVDVSIRILSTSLIR